MLKQTSLVETMSSPRPFGALRSALALGFLFVGALVANAACSGGTGTPGESSSSSGSASGSGGGGSTSNQTCEGVLRDGVCEGKCEPSKCVTENTCVGNRCMLKCDSHSDCYYDGSQNCAPAKEDDTGADIFVCQASTVPRGMGIKCPFGNECEQVGVCPNGQGCERAQCGGQPDACVRNEEACGTKQDCTIGKCPDNSPCKVNPCAASECSPLACLTTGEGDADAYCIRNDCASDADCAGGFFCGITRDKHELCGSDPQKGDNTLCGTTSESCIAAADLGKGNTLFEGSKCILRKSCIKRGQCSPCASDLDCSQYPTQRCVSIGGESRCARGCSVEDDCDPDYKCTEGSCVPRFGACKAQGNFCEPCQNDEDCGGKDTMKACIEASGGQRACFDYALRAADCTPDKGCIVCTSDTDCPKSPSGLNGQCADGRCFLPYNMFTNKYGCW